MDGKDLATINRMIQLNLSTYSIHQETFPRYKNINEGQVVVVVASGVSANRYKPIKNAVHIGVNRAFQINNYSIPMDYMFIQDYSGKTKEYIDELDKYRFGLCQKFYGLTTEYDYTTERTIPEYHVRKANALRYRTDWIELAISGGFRPQFAYDLSAQPLGCFGSIVFPALQFALWTHPLKIYLVGCDCTTAGYAYDKNDKNTLFPDRIIRAYKEFKNFTNKYYPDVEIISINPVGLKGLFKDITM